MRIISIVFIICFPSIANASNFVANVTDICPNSPANDSEDLAYLKGNGTMFYATDGNFTTETLVFSGSSVAYSDILDLGSNYSVNFINIQIRFVSSNGNDHIRVQTSIDNSTWITYGEFITSNYNLTLNIYPRLARYVRIAGYDDTPFFTGISFTIKEIKIYGRLEVCKKYALQYAASNGSSYALFYYLLSTTNGENQGIWADETINGKKDLTFSQYSSEASNPLRPAEDSNPSHSVFKVYPYSMAGKIYYLFSR
jgi:hypothetical protein